MGEIARPPGDYFLQRLAEIERRLRALETAVRLTGPAASAAEGREGEPEGPDTESLHSQDSSPSL